MEAGYRSGSLNVAGHAESLGRAVGAVSGPVTSVSSAGTHRLIRDGIAKIVTDGEDIRAMIDHQAQVPEPAVEKSVEREAGRRSQSPRQQVGGGVAEYAIGSSAECYRCAEHPYGCEFETARGHICGERRLSAHSGELVSSPVPYGSLGR